MLRAVNWPEDGVQAAGLVVALEAHDAGLVVAGRRRDAGAGHEHEAGLVLGVVLDVGRQHVQPVELGGQRRAEGGRPVGVRSPTWRAASAVELAATISASGSVLAKNPALAHGDGERHHPADVGQVMPGGASRFWLIGQHDLALDEEVVLEDQAVDTCRTVPSIEFSMATKPRSTSPVGRRGSTSGIDAHGDQLARGQVGLAEQRLLGEGARGAEEADPRSVGGHGAGG